MIIWGVTALGHDGAISVVKDNKIVFAGHTERYTRIKNDPNLCQEIVDEALSYGYPDEIVWYEKPLLKKTRQVYAGQWKEVFGKNTMPKKYLKKFGLGKIKVSTVKHHEAHAAAGVFTSGYKNAAVVVLDAIGEWNCCSIWKFNDGHLKLIENNNYPHSFGLFYSAFTQRCGLKPNEEEYILMGMSAYGDPNRYYEKMKPLLEQNLHRGCRWWLPGEQGQQDTFDMAAAAQKIYEEEFEKLVYKTKKMLPHNRSLVLMGGCALNCVANNIALKYFDDVWIMPAPGDSGSSLGAILAETETKVNWRGPYLGHNIEGDYPVDKLMKELLQGNMVGVANGRAEFGPRALGNRSLLADPRGTEVKDQVNAIKRRQEFRPFAPVVMEEHAKDIFNMPVDKSPYMQYVIQCSKGTEYPAIIHKDGTSRVQTVNKNQHLGLYTLLNEFYKETGCPMLLNTSLNIKGYPMVNTRKDGTKFQNKYKVKVY